MIQVWQAPPPTPPNVMYPSRPPSHTYTCSWHIQVTKTSKSWLFLFFIYKTWVKWFNWAMKKSPGWFGIYRGWNPTQLCGDYVINHEMRIQFDLRIFFNCVVRPLPRFNMRHFFKNKPMIFGELRRQSMMLSQQQESWNNGNKSSTCNFLFSNELAGKKQTSTTLPETNIAPKNGWLESYFPIGEAYFRGYVSFREGSCCLEGSDERSDFFRFRETHILSWRSSTYPPLRYPAQK